MSEVLLTAAFLEKGGPLERDFLIDNLLARNRFIMVMIRWTGLAPWESEFPFPGSLASTFLCERHLSGGQLGRAPRGSHSDDLGVLWDCGVCVHLFQLECAYIHFSTDSCLITARRGSYSDLGVCWECGVCVHPCWNGLFPQNAESGRGQRGKRETTGYEPFELLGTGRRGPGAALFPPGQGPHHVGGLQGYLAQKKQPPH